MRKTVEKVALVALSPVILAGVGAFFLLGAVMLLTGLVVPRRRA